MIPPKIARSYEEHRKAGMRYTRLPPDPDARMCVNIQEAALRCDETDEARDERRRTHIRRLNRVRKPWQWVPVVVVYKKTSGAGYVPGHAA